MFGKKKTTAVAALAAAAALTLSACATGGNGAASGGDSAESCAAPKAADSGLIYMASKGYQHQFWQAVQSGAEAKAKELGYELEFVGPEKETEIEKQVQQIDVGLGKNPVAMAVAALDPQAVIPGLQRACEAGIPVVAFDAPIEGSNVPVTTAATDNIAASALAADKLAEALGGKGKIAIIGHSETAQTGIDRVKGFTDRIAEKYPDIEIVDTQYADGDQAKSADAIKAIISANPDIVGVYGSNEGAAIGALTGLQEAGKLGDIKIVGFDSGKKQKDAIRSGEMYGAVTQNPVGIGSVTVESAVKALKGEKLEKVTDTGFEWYDSSNIDDPNISAMLYD